MFCRLPQGKASRYRLVLIVGAFFLFALPGNAADYDFNTGCRAAFREILCLQLNTAGQMLQEEKQRHPGNLVPVYLENYSDFLTLVIGEEAEQYRRLQMNRSSRIKALEQGPQNSPYHRLFLGEVYLQWAIARLKFGDYMTAAREMRKSYGYLAENSALYPGFLPNQVALGVVRVVLGLVPDEYKWITSLIGLEGSVAEGIGSIREAAGYAGSDPVARLYRPQAAFYLAFLTVNLQKNKEDALGIPALKEPAAPEEVPLESPLMIYARATILMRNGLNDRALEVLRERHRQKTEFPFRYLDYLEGAALLNKLDPGAAAWFGRFVSSFRGVSYIRSAYHKMAWASWLKNDTLGYRRLMRRVTLRGGSLTDEDKQATWEAASADLPNLRLLRARLLFDGGYYDRALAELLDHPVRESLRSKRDLLEYNYRLGRIYHEKGNIPRAVGSYRQTIAMGRNEPWYFSASAAYRLGMLFENEGERARADSAYRACLSMKPLEYRTSLHQKARSGIRRLGGR